MKCKVKSCSRKRWGKKEYCRTHYRRWKNYGDAYADILIKDGSKLSLANQRKILQAKPGYQYCQQCEKYKKTEEFPEARPCMCKYCERNIGLKKIYGIDNEDYNKLLKKQKGRCALCGTKNPGRRYNFFCIDHDHKTRKVRGLLCWICNAHVIGGIEARKIPVDRIAKYLQR